MDYRYQKHSCSGTFGDGSFMPAGARKRSNPRLLTVAKWLAICACGAYFVANRSILGSIALSTNVTVSPDLCLEPECIHAASEILYNLDPHYEDIDPCVDFDQYACGGWRDRHDMRPDQGSIFTGTFMSENAQMRLRHILEVPNVSGEQGLSSADKHNFKKLKSAYDACIDVEALKQRGSQPLDDLLAEIATIYYLHDEDPQKNLTDALLYLIQTDVSALATFSVSPDDRDPDNVAIFVTPPREIGLPSREFYNNTQVVEDYTNVVSNLLLLFKHRFSSDGESRFSFKLANKVILFEKKLADATPDTQAQEDVTQYYNPRTLDETKSLIPEISFELIVNSLAPKDFQAERFIIGSPCYLKKLSTIIQDTPREEQFVYVLDGTKWMSAEVRQLGKQKVANLIQKIGNPSKSPNLMDGEDVKKYYNELSVSRDRFFENSVGIAKFELKREWSQLGKPTNRDEWEMTAPTVNAYYNPPGNEIVFPAGIMQPPAFYGSKAPLYLAYGAFGAISGHELSHAFDSTGRHYDQTGNSTNWWDDRTVAAFEERAQCFVDQYSNFTVPGPDPDAEPLHVNGRLTLGENIADAGGIAASFHAWRKRDGSHADKALPGLENFTKEQLFFISYSTWWCSKTTKEAAVQAIYTDPHAPKPARILGTMANSREFREAFQCQTKEPVCELW
ncbi:hypothetical protein UA08_01169 [Talaromyces atroroseus]|uniref:Endothelin-converting enzyme 1 n=1 Tax=Talaromyces atroroseus TaxID=1441469 RepID=A0A1Q5QB28_TALAT|nr:hypothetical protein UA08_01169 [Talaromyces atroroseus]OKL63157.1 hypothetical protein UA08_01169 [Talaromyces atroroseus]